MLPVLSNVETFCLRLPTFNGIETLLGNALVISDWTAMNHPITFIACGAALWTYPIIFTWPVRPFKSIFVYALYLLGFEKGAVRKGSYASHYQRDFYGGYIPEYSTFSRLQSAATIGEIEDEEEPPKVPLYARALGWVAGALAVRAVMLF